MVDKKRIGLIFGGRSHEHDVSLKSASSVIENLDAQQYEVVPIYINRAGTWIWGVEPQQVLQSGAQVASIEAAPVVTLATNPQHERFISTESTQTLAANGALDVLFPVLHGPFGEDGTIQGLFEMAGLAYVGCGVLGSAVGMDKVIMKALFQAAGLPIVAALSVRSLEWERAPDALLDSVEQRLSYPCFVKPANLGSSVGVTKARTRQELKASIETAFSYDAKIVIEQGLACREFTCAVLGNEEPEVSVVGEILPGGEFSDYNDKYINHTNRFEAPSSLAPEQAEYLQALALRAYQALDLNGLARVDFFLDTETGQFYINEVNTLPGFTAQSYYPQLWAATGLPYPQLLSRLIELATQRFEQRQRIHAEPQA